MREEQRNYSIGIIGGAGCGKSSVLSILQGQADCQVIQADHIGHELMAVGQQLYTQVVTVFGNAVTDATGEIDRVKLGAIVFADEGSRIRLNRLSHPLIEAEIRRRIDALPAVGRLIFIEAALPRELHMTEYCDEIWWIKAGREIRIKRLMETRGYDFLRIQAVLRSQPTDMEYRQMAAVVLENDRTEETLRQRIECELRRLRGRKLCK
ncbi:MAG: dephospho-CoA kinase [Lachnospiraceae bacterium]|nr:dephospho-CoA kinase [Lachnospiraceae bacterium]MDY5741575.1 dephospho-CoA kinase [Lachnospiraceae bacterium]